MWYRRLVLSLLGSALIVALIGSASAAGDSNPSKPPTKTEKAVPAEQRGATAAKPRHAPAAAGRQHEVSHLPLIAEQQIREALLSPTSMEFMETPLSDVVDYLKDFHKIEICLDQPSLDERGLKKEKPITLNLKGVSLRSALKLMLRPLRLTYTIRDEVLLIVTPDQEQGILTTEVYEVRDLVAARDQKGQPANDFDQLIDVITSTVEPTTWDGVGGPGSIAPFEADGPAMLVVSQTWAVHEQIHDLLEMLRKTRTSRPGEPAVPHVLRPHCPAPARAASAGGGGGPSSAPSGKPPASAPAPDAKSQTR